jgi:hypothetical protein
MLADLLNADAIMGAWRWTVHPSQCGEPVRRVIGVCDGTVAKRESTCQRFEARGAWRWAIAALCDRDRPAQAIELDVDAMQSARRDRGLVNTAGPR